MDDAMKRVMVDTAHATRESLVDRVVEMATVPGQAEVPRGELAQMVNGFIEVLVEGIEGKTTAIRDQFVETLFPSLLETGETPGQLLSTTIRFHILATVHISHRLPESVRDEAVGWMAAYLGAYTADVAKVIQEAHRARK